MTSQQKKSSGRHRDNNHRRRRFNSSNRRRHKGSSTKPNTSTFEQLTKKYMQLVEQHQIARRKYYDYFHHRDLTRVQKLKKSFDASLNDLYNWQKSLPEKFKNEFFEKNKLDLNYSEIKEISPDGQTDIADEDIQDPHYTKFQQESNYSDDAEESVGTMDDYRSYKGQ